MTRELPGLRVFINYRRDDTPGQAGRLYDELTRRFGDDSVFMDVDKIDLGVDFKEAIEREVGRCDVLVALIGRHWFTVQDSKGRPRLDSPEDYVRIEIEAALDRNVRVIPALLEGATMPTSDELPGSLSGLARRNGLEIGDGARWRSDVARLVTALERIEESRPAPGSVPPVVTPPAAASRELDGDGLPERPVAGARLRGRLPLAVAVVAVLFALGGIAAGILLSRGSGGSSVSGGAEGHERVSHAVMGDYPDAIEDELLLAHIPAPMRHRCRRVDLAPDVLIRSVVCPGAPGITVRYGRAHSEAALRTYFLQKVASVGIDYPTRKTCRAHRLASGEWERAGLQTHLEGLSRAAEGRVLCYDDASNAWIVWTDTPTKIFAIASAPVGERKGLYAWWRAAAGPEKELAMGAGATGHGAMHGLDPYPDAIEDELLINHLPPAIAKTCHRSAVDAYDRQVFLRAVDCEQTGDAGPVRFALAHSGTALKGYALNRVTAAGLDYPTRESCASSPAAADSWVRVGQTGHVERSSRNAEGRVLCFEQGGSTSLEWSDGATLIYSSASRPSGRRAALYAWWRRQAGPGTLEMHSLPGAMQP